MTENNEPTDPATGDPANAETAPDAAAQIEQAVEKEYRTLDDLELSPAKRRVIDERIASERAAAVNGYVEKRKSSGDGMTQADLQRELDKRDQEYAAKDKARSEMERTLIQAHGIAVGSEDYDKFSAAAVRFKPGELRTPEGIAMIVRAAGIKTVADAVQAARTGTDALYSPKAYDGTDLPGLPPGGISIKDLDAQQAG